MSKRMHRHVLEPHWHQEYENIFQTYTIKLRRTRPDYHHTFFKKKWWRIRSNISWWLQCKAWTFLQSQANVSQYKEALKREVRYSSVELDVEKLSTHLMKHTDVLYSIFRHECDTIFLGNEALAHLKMEARYNWYNFHIPLDTPPTLDDGKQLHSLAGMNIICVPWFQGVLAINSKEVLRSGM